MRRLALALLLAGAPLASRGAAADAADPVAARFATLAAELERDRADPRALVVLAELEELDGELDDLARAVGLHAALADDAAAHPEVRAYARLRLAELERARGNLRRADAELRRLAFVDGWSVAGPFDNEGKRGFDAVFPPERAQRLDERFPGKAREVGWRALPPEATTLGFTHLGAVVRPAREVTVYALAVLDAPREERVRLHLGASGAVKVFVNGALVHADAKEHPARLDQAAVAFTLRKGPNRLLLKLAHAEGVLGFYARLAAARGEPLRLPALRAATLPPPQAAAAARAEAVPGILAALERRAASARGAAAAAARIDLARALALRGVGNGRERRAAAEARRAVESAPRSLDARLLAARLEDDSNRRREHLQAAVAAAPRDARALLALARAELERSRLVAARELVERALAAAPGSVAARLLLADVQDAAGFAARARALREAAARDAPLHPGAVLAAARAARLRDRLEPASHLLRKALALRHDDAAARATLVGVLLDAGDVDGAVRLQEEAIRLEPADVSLRLRLADLLAANGRGAGAEAAFAAAAQLAPDDPEIPERRGQARLRAGRQGEALADFAAALQLRPQNPRLQELVRALEPSGGRFEAPYLQDAAALARAAPAAGPDDDALVLGDLKVTRVFPSGLSSSYTQLVVKVLTSRGVDAWRSWSTHYAPERQEVKVERARVVKPDGSVVEAHSESDRSTSEPWYRLYYDTRVRQLGFPALAAGDLLEIAVRVDDVASENLLADYFGEVVFLADATRRARTDYVLLAPEGRPIHAADPALPGVEKSERTLPGGVVERRWTARDVPAVRAEPGMPGWSEVAPFVHVSTYASWDDVARFYWGLVREQVTPTAEVRETALRLAGEVRAERRARGEPESGDALALVQAAHRFVVTQTRYVALEFGIHGYKPYRVEQILERRFGDCKDKASLTHALLEALGLESRLVLLRMKRLGRMPEKPASLAVFNHAILYVPAFDLWLDGTASYSGSKNLPAEDRGATVLVVNPGAPARFATIPDVKPEENATATRYEVALAADGSAAVRGEARAGGATAPSWRRAYAAEDDRRARLEGAMSGSFPGVSVREVAVSDLARLEEDVTLTFALAAPRLAEREGGGLRFPAFGAAQRFAERIAPLSERRFDLVVGEPWQSRYAWRWTLPAGWRARALPAPVKLEEPFGRFEATFREEGGAVVAEAQLTVRTGRVSARDYPAFRAFLSGVDRALASPLRAEPAPGPTAAR